MSTSFSPGRAGPAGLGAGFAGACARGAGSGVDQARACISDASDPRVIRCQAGGEWLTGSQASVILSSLGDRPVIALSAVPVMERELAVLEQAVNASHAADMAARAARIEVVLRNQDGLDDVSAIYVVQVLRWGLAGLTGLSAAFMALIWWILRAPIPVVVRRERVQVGGRSIAASEIASCDLLNDGLILALHDGESVVLGGLERVGGSSHIALRDAIRGLVLSPAAREAEARAEVELRAHQARLRARSPAQGD